MFLPHRYNLDRLIWSSVSEPIIIAYTSARAFMHATPQCMLARYSLEWLGNTYFSRAERLMFASLSASDFVLLLLRKTCAEHVYPHIDFPINM